MRFFKRKPIPQEPPSPTYSDLSCEEVPLKPQSTALSILEEDIEPLEPLRPIKLPEWHLDYPIEASVQAVKVDIATFTPHLKQVSRLRRKATFHGPLRSHYDGTQQCGVAASVAFSTSSDSTQDLAFNGTLAENRDQSDTSKANDTTREYLDRGRPFTKRYNEDARDLDSLFYRPRRERESVSQMLARVESRPDESASNEEAPVSQPVYLVDQVTPVKVQDSETSPSIHSNLDSPMVRTEETLPSTPSSVSFRSGEPRHLGLYRNGLRADHHGLPLTELEDDNCPSYTPSFFTDPSDRASVRPPSHSGPEVISRRGFRDVVKDWRDDTVSLFKSHAPTGTRGSLASRNDGHGIFKTKMSRVRHRLKNGWTTRQSSLFGSTA